jgi:3'(2'), 5'-bisphosphate nucleotidase
MHELLFPVIDIAEQAGDAILAVYCRDCATFDKHDRSPLTEADLAAHHLILSRLAALSDLPVLSEESAGVAWTERSTWKRYWLVDPLDGTKEFLSRNGEFTVNLALIENGKPVLGVVHAPALKRTYFAAQGQGAFRRDDGAEADPIRVSPRPERIWRVVGSRSHHADGMEDFLRHLGETALVAMGSSLKFCIVAEGFADLYPRLAPTCEWDTAAAQCIVEEAGGAVLTEGMVPLSYNAKESLLNPHFIACGARDAAWMDFFAGRGEEGA